MPEFKGRGFRIHYVEDGKGPAIVFAHGFCMDHTMYVPQFEDLPETYRCVAWDMRGHGRSECPPGPWTMQDLVVDLISFIEAVNASPCHLVGMSIGGMVAVRLAIQREDLVRSLVLVDTSADSEPPDVAAVYRGFQEQIVEHDGISDELAAGTLPIFYGPTYMEADPEALKYHVEREQGMPTTALVQGLDALLGRDSVVDRLGEIRVPTLVIHGEVDQAIPIERAQELADGIPGAELIRVPDAGHSTPLEAPDVVNEALAGFFARVNR